MDLIRRFDEKKLANCRKLNLYLENATASQLLRKKNASGPTFTVSPLAAVETKV